MTGPHQGHRSERGRGERVPEGSWAGCSETRELVRIRGGVKEKRMTEADQGPGMSMALQRSVRSVCSFQRDGLCVISADTA